MVSADEATPRPMVLGRYELIAEIARGGMGIVYLANMQGVGGFRKLVVLKELKPELARDEDFVGMFMSEAKLSARLNHRNVVQTNEVGSAGDRHFLTMEYLEGRSLHRVLRRFNRKGSIDLPADFSIRAIAETLDGLHYAHELADYDGEPLGIVHRDVSPNNIFITFDGQVKLLDFGVAKTLDRVQETQAGMLKGRVRYMAPEQVSGHADRRSDVFSAGAILREIATGVRVWGNTGDLEILGCIAKGEIPPFPESTGAPVAAELRRVIEKAMAPNVLDRYPTARAMRLDLQAYLEGRGQLADLGAHVTEAFASEEKAMRERIDTHLTNSAGRTELLRLDGSWGPSSGSASGAAQRSGASVSSVSAHRASAVGSHTQLSATSRTDEHAALSRDDRFSAGGSRALTLVIALGAVGVVAGGIAALILMLKAPSAPVAPAQSPLTTSSVANDPAAARPAKTGSAHVTIRVSPPNAQIFLDSAAVGQAPFDATFPLTSDPHTVRVIAAGYVPKTESVVFGSSEVSLSISLERSGGGVVFVPVPVAAKPTKPAPTTVAAGSTSVAPAPATDIDPRGGKLPKREVDPNDPYGGK
jgi:eukaryotic-like serine/threonine-protein kinase